MKRTPTQWFNKWKSIISKEREISRVALAELSGCSIWTIKALQRDFLDWDAYIMYEHGKFSLINSLSLEKEIEIE